MTTFFVSIVLMICVVLALRSLKNSKGCSHDCSQCGQSCSTIQQGLQELLAESKKNK